MNEAQIGLLVVTPAVVGVAFALYREGVMAKGAMVGVSLAAVAVAASMFLTQ